MFFLSSLTLPLLSEIRKENSSAMSKNIADQLMLLDMVKIGLNVITSKTS